MDRVTILPEQARRVYQEAIGTGAAVGLSQVGSILIINTGQQEFSINAKGEEIPRPNQERLC